MEMEKNPMPLQTASLSLFLSPQVKTKINQNDADKMNALQNVKQEQKNSRSLKIDLDNYI